MNKPISTVDYQKVFTQRAELEELIKEWHIYCSRYDWNSTKMVPTIKGFAEWILLK